MPLTVHNKKIYARIFVVMSAIFFGVLLPLLVFAQTQDVVPISVADFRIDKIDGFNIKGVFSAENRAENFYPDVAYVFTIIDQEGNEVFFYNPKDVFKLQSKESKDFSFTVQYPSYIENGTYRLELGLLSTKGENYGFKAVPVVLEGEGPILEIRQENAKILYKKRPFGSLEGINIESGEAVQGEFIVASSLKETEFRTELLIYDRDVIRGEVGRENGPFEHLNRGETKIVTFDLPLRQKSGSYLTAVYFKDENGTELAPPIYYRYVITGLRSYFSSMSLDKESYKEGDIANVALNYIGTVEMIPGSTLDNPNKDAKANLSIKIYGEDGILCGAAEEELDLLNKEGDSFINKGVSIKKNCNNAGVFASMDKNGQTFDDYAINVPEKIKTAAPPLNNKLLIILIVGLAVILGAVIVYFYIRKKKTAGIGLLVFIIAMFLVNSNIVQAQGAGFTDDLHPYKLDLSGVPQLVAAGSSYPVSAGAPPNTFPVRFIWDEPTSPVDGSIYTEPVYYYIDSREDFATCTTNSCEVSLDISIKPLAESYGTDRMFAVYGYTDPGRKERIAFSEPARFRCFYKEVGENYVPECISYAIPSIIENFIYNEPAWNKNILQDERFQINGFLGVTCGNKTHYYNTYSYIDLSPIGGGIQALGSYSSKKFSVSKSVDQWLIKDINGLDPKMPDIPDGVYNIITQTFVYIEEGRQYMKYQEMVNFDEIVIPVQVGSGAANGDIRVTKYYGVAGVTQFEDPPYAGALIYIDDMDHLVMGKSSYQDVLIGYSEGSHYILSEIPKNYRVTYSVNGGPEIDYEFAYAPVNVQVINGGIVDVIFRYVPQGILYTHKYDDFPLVLGRTKLWAGDGTMSTYYDIKDEAHKIANETEAEGSVVLDVGTYNILTDEVSRWPGWVTWYSTPQKTGPYNKYKDPTDTPNVTLSSAGEEIHVYFIYKAPSIVRDFTILSDPITQVVRPTGETDFDFNIISNNGFEGNIDLEILGISPDIITLTKKGICGSEVDTIMDSNGPLDTVWLPANGSVCYGIHLATRDIINDSEVRSYIITVRGTEPNNGILRSTNADFKIVDYFLSGLNLNYIELKKGESYSFSYTVSADWRPFTSFTPLEFTHISSDSSAVSVITPDVSYDYTWLQMKNNGPISGTFDISVSQNAQIGSTYNLTLNVDGKTITCSFFCDPLSHTNNSYPTRSIGAVVRIVQAPDFNIEPRDSIVRIGDSIQYRAYFTDYVGVASEVTDSSQWISTNSAVADINIGSSGMAEAYQEGQTTIIANYAALSDETSLTVISVCGDGVLGSGEECDDMNSNNTDTCIITNSGQPAGVDNCVNAFCGDGYVCSDSSCSLLPSGIEQCDTGGESSACDADCTFAVCGDSIVNNSAGEECDDGNTVSGDNCSAVCKWEVCGDGIIQSPNKDGVFEQCDDMNSIDNDSCNNSCQLNVPACTIMNVMKSDNSLLPDTLKLGQSLEIKGVPTENNEYIWFSTNPAVIKFVSDRSYVDNMNNETKVTIKAVGAGEADVLIRDVTKDVNCPAPPARFKITSINIPKWLEINPRK